MNTEEQIQKRERVLQALFCNKDAVTEMRRWQAWRVRVEVNGSGARAWIFRQGRKGKPAFVHRTPFETFAGSTDALDAAAEWIASR